MRSNIGNKKLFSIFVKYIKKYNFETFCLKLYKHYKQKQARYYLTRLFQEKYLDFIINDIFKNSEVSISNVNLISYIENNFNFQKCKECNKNINRISLYNGEKFCGLKCSNIFYNRSRIGIPRTQEVKDKISTINKGRKIVGRDETTRMKKYWDNAIKKYGSLENFKKFQKEQQDRGVIEKYGSVENYYKHVRERAEKTCLEKYGSRGYGNPDKVKLTSLQRYGVPSYSMSKIKNLDKLTRDYLYFNFIKNNSFQIYEAAEFYGVCKGTIEKYKRNFDLEMYPNTTRKHKQFELFSRIQIENKIMDTRRIINPLELDIFIPDYNLAIEYNGLMFHSFGKHKHSMFNNFDREDPKNLLRKNELCDTKNIELLHIFENENIDAWISIIHNKLNINPVLDIENPKNKRNTSQKSFKISQKESHLHVFC